MTPTTQQSYRNGNKISSFILTNSTAFIRVFLALMAAMYVWSQWVGQVDTYRIQNRAMIIENQEQIKSVQARLEMHIEDYRKSMMEQREWRVQATEHLRELREGQAEIKRMLVKELREGK